MQNGVQWRPFLEENIDKLIRNHPGWCLEAHGMRLNRANGWFWRYREERADAEI